MAQPFDLSIVICTYNGAARLPEVLDRLDDCWHYGQQQAESQGQPLLRWEVLVVDNNSTDHTVDVVKSYQAAWSNGLPLRYLFDRRQGAAYARKTGVANAQSDLIGFLDDDNLPAQDWVIAAHAFAQAHPRAGAFGSCIQGEFEVEPAPELAPILPFLAIVQRGDQPLQYQSLKKVLPPSAGLVVRRTAWEFYIPQDCLLGGRTIQSMVTGEDTEALTYIQRAGWEIWYNPQMRVWHKIPRWRLEPEYLIPFFRGIGLSRHVTRMQSLPVWLRPLAFWLYLLNDLRKVCVLGLTHGFQLRQNLVARCQLTLGLASLRSPFYVFKQSWVKPVRAPQSSANPSANSATRSATHPLSEASAEGTESLSVSESAFIL